LTEVPIWRPHGAPCWVSLLVHDLEGALDFYGRLLGWQFDYGGQPFGPYARAELNGRPVAGLGEIPTDRRLPVAWTTYFAAEDVDVTTAQIRSCGGTVAVGPLDAGDAVRMSIAADPLGAVFGVWQAKADRGVRCEYVGEPGTPAWNELLTRETSAAGRFYARVFGCETEAVVSADHDYLTLCTNGRPIAGIHGVGRALLRDRGAHWMTYFAVKDTDDAAHHVAELGGNVLRQPRDSGYGRVATVTDREGAVFTLLRTDR
jgi:uncharacterized protein